MLPQFIKEVSKPTSGCGLALAIKGKLSKMDNDKADSSIWQGSSVFGINDP